VKRINNLNYKIKSLKMVESVGELWGICYEKQYVYRAWFNKYVSKFSIYLTWLLLHTPITPNQVTIIELVLVILSSAFFIFGKLQYIFIGFLILQFTNLLDCVDGEIARYRKKSSLVGAHLENIYHQLISYLMFFPLAFGIFLYTSWKSVLIFGFLCSIFSKSIIIPNMFTTIIESRLRNNNPIKNLKRKNIKTKTSDINLQGTDTGKRLSELYDKFKDFWAAPTNIVHLTIISIIELVNQHYEFMPSYILFYWYLVVYSIVIIMIQITSFVVHYKGRAAEQYYKSLFGEK